MVSVIPKYLKVFFFLVCLFLVFVGGGSGGSFVCLDGFCVCVCEWMCVMLFVVFICVL